MNKNKNNSTNNRKIGYFDSKAKQDKENARNWIKNKQKSKPF